MPEKTKAYLAKYNLIIGEFARLESFGKKEDAATEKERFFSLLPEIFFNLYEPVLPVLSFGNSSFAGGSCYQFSIRTMCLRFGPMQNPRPGFTRLLVLLTAV